MLLAMGIGLGFIEVARAAERSSGAKSKSKDSVESAELTFRLPRYFSSIVDDDQRTQIRQIQISYHDKMEPLREELAELEAAQLKAIEALLSSAQRKALEQLRAGDTKRSTSTSGRTSRATSSGASKSPAKSSKSRSTASKSAGSKSAGSKSGKSGSSSRSTSED